MDERRRELIDLYEARDAGRAPPVQVPTGFERLDEKGLIALDILTTLAGHPGDGKSALALQIAEGAARAGMDAITFWLEDPQAMVADREIAPALGVSGVDLRRLTLQEDARTLALRMEAMRRDAAPWMRRIAVEDFVPDTGALMDRIGDLWTPATKLVIVDYAQAFDAEADEKSVERVISRLAWNLNRLAKDKRCAVLLLSQVKREVMERGRQWYSSWRWRQSREGGDPEPSPDMVEGFRPGAGDMQWSTQLQQRTRQALYIFRPGQWMRALGANAKDDTMEVDIDKGNYGPSKAHIVLGWDGPAVRVVNRIRGGR